MNAKEYYASLNKYKDQHSSLQHHGIIGQKWGVRRFQEKDGTYTQAGRERYGIGQKKERDGSTEEIGDPAVLALLALYTAPIAITVGASAIHDAKISSDIKKYEKHRATEETDPKTGLKLKDNPDATVKQDMRDINREHEYWMFHGDEREGTTRNCMLCTTALDLKRKGYDVKAGKVKNGFNDDELKKWYKKPEITRDRIEEIFRKLEKEPEGSYGNFMCTWEMGGGHSMFYRIENGKVAVYDAQSNQYYKDIKTSDLYHYMWGGQNRTAYCRTDNLEVNIDYLKEHEYIR